MAHSIIIDDDGTVFARRLLGSRYAITIEIPKIDLIILLAVDDADVFYLTQDFDKLAATYKALSSTPNKESKDESEQGGEDVSDSLCQPDW